MIEDIRLKHLLNKAGKIGLTMFVSISQIVSIKNSFLINLIPEFREIVYQAYLKTKI